jgi:hypothetical protein
MEETASGARAMNLGNRLQHIFGGTSIQETCQRAVNAHFPEVGRSTVAIEPSWLCEIRGIVIQHVNHAPFEGRLERNDSDEYAVTLRKTSPIKQRFTIAHELGHWIIQRSLDDRKEQLFRGAPIASAEAAEEERLADLLAAEILMPYRQIKDYLSQPFTHDLVSAAMQQFSVHRQLFLSRYAELAAKRVLYLQCFPSIFKRQDAEAIIDDGWMVEPGDQVRRICRRARFAEPIAFNKLSQRAERGIWIQLEAERSLWSFECRYQFGVIARTSLLSSQRKLSKLERNLKK